MGGMSKHGGLAGEGWVWDDIDGMGFRLGTERKGLFTITIIIVINNNNNNKIEIREWEECKW